MFNIKKKRYLSIVLDIGIAIFCLRGGGGDSVILSILLDIGSKHQMEDLLITRNEIIYMYT